MVVWGRMLRLSTEGAELRYIDRSDCSTTNYGSTVKYLDSKVAISKQRL